jgi:hypothetical protein
VALDEDLVTGPAVGLAAEEVVETDLVQRGRTGVGRQVSADALVLLVGAHDHHGRVPADHRPDATLEILVAGEPGFVVARDRVDVGRRHRRRELDLQRPGALDQFHQQEPGTRTAVGGDDRVEGVDPLGGLFRIDVRKLMRNSVEKHEVHAPTAERAGVTTAPDYQLVINDLTVP